MHDEHAVCADQPEGLHEIPPGRLELMPGIDKHNVEAAALLADFRQAFANVESGAAIVDGEAIIKIVWATITSAGGRSGVSPGRSRHSALRS